MEDARRYDLEYLMLRIDGDIPDFLWDLPPEDLSQVRRFIQQVFENETAGLDKMMEGGLTTLKFFPKFLIKAIALKYVAPFYVEYTASKLPLKQELELSKVAYPTAYIAEGLRYTADNALCARKIMVQKPQTAEQVTQYLCERYPMKSLDIAAELKSSQLSYFARYFSVGHHDHPLMTERRRATLERLQTLLA